MGPELSVVVATRDRPQMLEECLAALERSVAPDDEVIVVDSASNPHNASLVAAAAERHGARLVVCHLPGASLARNTGWHAGRHGVVAFVDDDVRVSDTWADGVRGVFDDHRAVAFVTGRLALDESGEAAERPVAHFDRADAGVIDQTTAREFGHGANLAVRRGALEAVGGYAEEFGPGARWPAAEDLELLDRLLGAGFAGRYEPSAVATHVQWRARRDLVPLEWSYGVGQGARLARLWSSDRPRARLVGRPILWDDGARDLARCVRRGYEFGALLALTRLAATARGALGYALTNLRSGRGARGDR